MSDCAAVREQLEAYALGFLDPAEREAAAAHLDACASCRTEAEEIRATIGRLDRLPARLPLGSEARKRIAAVARPPSRRRWAVAAACLMAIGAGALAVRSALRQEAEIAALSARVELQAGVIEGLRTELREERDAVQAALRARLDRQDELLRRIQSTEDERAAALDRRFRELGDGLAGLRRRSDDQAERLARLGGQVEALASVPPPPRPEPVAKAEPAPAPAVAPLEAPADRNPVEAAQGFLWDVFRDRGGNLNRKIRNYREELNRSYENR